MTITTQLSELAALIDRYCSGEGIHDTAITSLQVIKSSSTNMRVPEVYAPSLCIIVQGSKQVMLGEEVLQYSPSQYLAASVDLPIVGQVITASKAQPYLCVKVDIDSHLLTELVADGVLAGAAAETTHGETTRGLFVGALDMALGDAVLRLVRLLESPSDIRILAPTFLREIHYRMLQSQHGATIAQMAMPDSYMHRVATAIRAMRADLARPIRVNELAEQVSMSASSFHHHFRLVTAMSPLQYLKCLRLTQARKIMLTERCDAATTAYRVGYESPSQFSREYSRMFGAPPMRDVQALRGR